MVSFHFFRSAFERPTALLFCTLKRTVAIIIYFSILFDAETPCENFPMKSSQSKLLPTPSETRKKSVALPLVVVLAFLLVLLPISRKLFFSRPPPPPETASVNAKMKYYAGRAHTDPSDTAAYVQLGKLEEGSGYFLAALTHFEIARALGVPEKEYLLPLGRSLTHLARWDEADAVLQKAVTLMPDSIEAASNYAGMFYNNGRAEEASRVLREFLKLHPQFGDAAKQQNIEDVRLMMLRFSEAGDVEMTLKLADKVAELDPKDVGAFSIAGKALLSLHRNPEALIRFEKAYALDQNVAALCFQYAVALKLTGKNEEALKLFQKCVALNPSAVEAYENIAEAYEKKKNWKMQSIALNEAASRSKGNTLLIFRTARSNEKAGYPSEAAYWYAAAALASRDYPRALSFAKKLSANPNPRLKQAGLKSMADAYYGLHLKPEFLATMKKLAPADTAKDYLTLAQAYEQADLLEDQIKYLKLALEKEPKAVAIVHYNLSLTASRRALRDEAEAEMKSAVEADPKSAEYHRELGLLYYERRTLGDRLQLAIKEYEMAARLNPSESVEYQHLGIAYAAANDLKRAAINLEHAIDLQPGHGPAYQELGRVYAKQGEKESSERMFALYKKYVAYDLELKTLQARADSNLNAPVAQIAYADLLAKSGDLTSAASRYNTALQNRPSDMKTKLKLQRIYNLLGQNRDPLDKTTSGKPKAKSK